MQMLALRKVNNIMTMKIVLVFFGGNILFI
jgi:hypothetical protein